MAGTAALPGLTVELVRPPAEQSPLRSDVAGVIGRTRRGPVAEPARVDGQRDLLARFGGLDARFATGYGLRGYFANGGEIVHVIRLNGTGGSAATATWTIGEVTGVGFSHASYTIEATSPGEWANGTTVTVTYHASGLSRRDELELRVDVPGEDQELFAGVAPADVIPAMSASRFVRLVPDGPRIPGPPAAAPTGPSFKAWDTVLGGGADPVPGRDDYLQAAAMLGDVTEAALVAVPDLHTDLGEDAGQVLGALLGDAVARQDRLVLVDVPPAYGGPIPAAAWVERLRETLGSERLRAAAVYHPWVRVPDPLGRADAPLRDVPPSGHVAGLASRLDRQRGAQHTPANALLSDAVDLATRLDLEQEALIYAGGLNPLRCRPGLGLEVWGGRTLDPDPARRFVAHRRLLHRLVRAIRRVAEPLVFEPNGPVLRFALVRGISSVLLEAWRAGGLKGTSPEQGFQVRCDEGNNPPEAADLGQVLCEVFVAPAVPMEFIRILLTIAPEGALEVVEA
jgi:hypothetical protein